MNLFSALKNCLVQGGILALDELERLYSLLIKILAVLVILIPVAAFFNWQFGWTSANILIFFLFVGAGLYLAWSPTNVLAVVGFAGGLGIVQKILGGGTSVPDEIKTIFGKYYLPYVQNVVVWGASALIFLCTLPIKDHSKLFWGAAVAMTVIGLWLWRNPGVWPGHGGKKLVYAYAVGVLTVCFGIATMDAIPDAYWEKYMPGGWNPKAALPSGADAALAKIHETERQVRDRDETAALEVINRKLAAGATRDSLTPTEKAFLEYKESGGKEKMVTPGAGTREAGVTEFELVGVHAPTGKDASGNNLFSPVVRASRKDSTFGFEKSDPGTGCFLVRVNGKDNGEACKDGFFTLNLDGVEGGKLDLQFHGKDRPMKLFVRRPIGS